MNRDDETKAFNAGCDARIAGIPKDHNPFLENKQLALEWQHGWYHVNRYWACDLHPDQPVPFLEPVRDY